MKHVIILKGERNSGKSTTLRDFLPLVFGERRLKKSISYRGKKIYIISSSIHERPTWRTTIDRIVQRNYDIFVVAAWPDNRVEASAHIRRRIEDILAEERLGGFECFEVFTQIVRRENQEDDHQRCAHEIKAIVDSIVFS